MFRFNIMHCYVTHSPIVASCVELVENALPIFQNNKYMIVFYCSANRYMYITFMGLLYAHLSGLLSLLAAGKSDI